MWPEKMMEDVYMPTNTEEKCVFNWGYANGWNKSKDSFSSELKRRASVEVIGNLINGYLWHNAQNGTIYLSHRQGFQLAEAISKHFLEGVE